MDTKNNKRGFAKYHSISGFAPVILLILIALLAGGGYYVYKNFNLTPKIAVQTSSPVPTATANLTTNWQIHTDPQYGYQFKCPATSRYDVAIITQDGTDKPFKSVICSEGNNQFEVSVLDPIMETQIAPPENGIYQSIQKTPDKKYLIKLRGFDNTYYSQILSTFKFTNAVTTLSNQLVLLDNVYKCCVNTNDVYGDPMKFVLNLPGNFKILTSGSISEVSLGESKFTVIGKSGGMSGPCPMDGSDTSCGYDDEKLNNIPILRVWKNKNGVFMLNPQEITIDNYYLDSVLITKESPSKIFSNQEISDWKSALSTVGLAK